MLPTLPQDTFVYLDPPYYVKGKGLYEHFYEHNDHAEIAQLVREVSQQWIVSYDAAPEILELYKDHQIINYGLSYSAAARYRGSEVMFLGPQLIQPPVESPANVGFNIVRRMQKEMLLF